MNKKTFSKESSNNGVTIRNYPETLCRIQKPKNGGSPFRAVSFRFRGNWGSFLLPEEDISQSTKRNGDPAPGRMNISLGAPDYVRFVSLKEQGGGYRRQPMFNSTILSAIDEERQSYLRSIAI